MGRSSANNTPRREPITDRGYIFQFGKYKNYSLDDIMDVDRQYLVWLHNNSNMFELSAELLDEAEGGSDEHVWRTDEDGNLIL